MNRAEIIEGLKEIHDRFYAFTDYRKTTEACLELLENENALIDRALEIIDKRIQFAKDCRISTIALWLVRNDILALKGVEQEC